MLGLGNQIPKTSKVLENVAQPSLLDSYSGATGAYSLRRLDQDYIGSCLKVRRTTGTPATQDIGFDANGNIDVAAIESFCAGTDGWLDTWYDQSGSGNNATTATEADQPKLVSSGTFLGHLTFDNNLRHICFYDVDGNHTIFFVFKSSDSLATIFDGRSGGGGFVLVAQDGSSNATISHLVGSPTLSIDGAAVSPTTRDDVHTLLMDNTKKLLSVNNIDFQSTATEWAPMYMGDYGGFEFAPAEVYEIVIYPSHLDASTQAGVEGNIMTHHNL